MSIDDLQYAMVAKQADLRFATDDLRVLRARIEQDAIVAAGGENRLGSNADARERKLLLIVRDNLKYAEALRKLRAMEIDAEDAKVAFDAAIRAIRREEWANRTFMADALNKVSSRPCEMPGPPSRPFIEACLRHAVELNLVSASTEDESVRGESDYMREAVA